jgi:hypothetical protein
MRYRGWWLVTACGVWAACVPWAAAQGVQAANELISRRTVRGSQSIVGGRTIAAGRTRSLRATQTDAYILARQTYEYLRSQRSGLDTRVLGVSQLGLFRNLAGPSGEPLSSFKDRTGEVASLSGLSQAMSLNVPLPYVGPGGLPTLNAFQYTPRPATSAFEDFFGLSPAPAPRPADWKPAIPSVAAELDRRTADRGKRAEQEGVALFKAGTVETRDARTGRFLNCRDCEESLFQAKQKLLLARDIAGRSYWPCVLLAHIALEEERPTLALSYLLEALDRNPQLFTEDPAQLHQYYGDAQGGGRSAVLEAQLRRYVRIGELNPRSPHAYALGAYCAWRLGDEARLREALRQGAESVGSEVPGTERVANFVMALLNATGGPSR